MNLQLLRTAAAEAMADNGEASVIFDLNGRRVVMCVRVLDRQAVPSTPPAAGKVDLAALAPKSGPCGGCG